ncbi:hypothetical protein KGQ19_33535 [Catenulispora sp. NL8]|uniref:Uncharacterized protein n=1 Tax=Catenulispora pinistramenti TaxID=2705254 RepID=A0ABS5L0N2_9ACTN|nr:hypothetical protein [Catenulispora pinistramenti]MBS2551800.1 hypothetical protein [Catenulispora pinistramenti]
MSEDPESLPLNFDHRFQLWSYSKSHRTLVMRGRPGEAYDEYVDIVFMDVLGMKLASGYSRLTVSAADDPSEMDELLRAPERYSRGFINVEVSDGDTKGFVVCKRVTVRRGTGWQEEKGR